MKLSLSAVPLVCTTLLFIPSYLLAQSNIFAGLPYDAAQLRESIELHSTRIEAEAGSQEIPRSISYRIFVQELLADPNPSFDISIPDTHILQDLVKLSTRELADKDRGTLTELCASLPDLADSSTQIIDLATLFDESRIQGEQELESQFAEALEDFSPETARAIAARWEDFRQHRTIVYTTFDMAGFAREVPDAAHRVLLAGCSRFQNMLRDR